MLAIHSKFLPSIAAKRGLLYLVALMFIIFQFSHSASAFEGYEHKAMGDLAIQVVQKICADDLKHEICAANWKDAITQLVPCKNGDCTTHNITYGDILRCVDAFLVPEKMLSVSDNLGHSSGNIPKFWLPIKPEELMINPDFEHCDAGRGGELAAAHANHTHFQNDLLVALNLHHSAAIGFALQSRNPDITAKRLYGALVMNAIADHYLQDFFAPGHMVTPRSKLTDTASNSVHDLANDQGLKYYLDPAVVHKLFGNVENEKRLHDAIATVSEQLVCRPSKLFKFFPLNIRDDTKPDCPEQIKDSANSDVEEALDSLKSKKTVMLKGDKLLWRTSDDGLKQRVLMILVNVQSILDVVKANNTKEFADSFDEVGWKYESSIQDTQNHENTKSAQVSNSIEPIVTTKTTLSSEPSCASRRNCTPIGFGSGQYEIQNTTGNSTHHTSDKTGEYKEGTYSTLIGFQYARESFTSGAHFGRNAYEAYIAPSLYTHGYWNIIPNYGLVWLNEGPFAAHGASLRIDFTVPNTETTIAPYIRRIKYPNYNAFEWNTSYGIRVEQGFTSFMTLFIGLGKDYGPSPNLGLERGWMFTAGANFSLPFIRAKTMLTP